MAAKSEAARSASAIADVAGQVGRTLEAAVTQPPGWQELAWDAVPAGATLVEAMITRWPATPIDRVGRRR